MAKKGKAPASCPCGSGRLLTACCGPLLEGAAAATPEALMRSRYTAYALGCDDYVLATWAPETRPAVLFEEGDVRPKWRSLSVIEAPLPAEDADEGTVTFTAAGRTSAGAFRLTEKSRFRREAGRWFYVNGDVSED